MNSIKGCGGGGKKQTKRRPFIATSLFNKWGFEDENVTNTLEPTIVTSEILFSHSQEEKTS